MKKYTFLTLSLLLLSSMTLAGCATNPSQSGGNESNDAVVTIKKLQIKQNPTKTSFEVGEAFTSEGLKIKLVEMSDNQVIKENETSDYHLTYDGGKELKEGTILSEGDFEVMVISNDKSVRSTSFNIEVRLTNKLASLYSVVKKMVDTNNYTVDNDVGSDNHVKGLMTKDALLWDASEQAYFMDEDFGYGTHDNKTFRYNLIDNQIKNATYLVDLGGKVNDRGLFDIDTVDDMAERRISNYNIKGITNDDLTYLENLEPTEDNPNRYQIDATHSKWLFNAIGHTQLTINPVYFLTGGSADGKIYLEVKDYGLDVTLITANGVDGIKGCQAKITKIGETIIPGMKEFMENPVFNKAETVLDKFQKLILSNNYQFLYSEENRDVIFNQDYIYGSEFKYNAINLKANNKLNKQPGYYQFEIVDNKTVNVKDEKVAKLSYLSKFNIFKNLNDYFVADETNPTVYKYKVNSIKEQTSQLGEYLTTFTKYKMEAVSYINLNFMFVGNSIYQATIEVIVNNEVFDSLIVTNFNATNNELIDDYLLTLY